MKCDGENMTQQQHQPLPSREVRPPNPKNFLYFFLYSTIFFFLGMNLTLVAVDKNNNALISNNAPPLQSPKSQGTKLERLPQNEATARWKLWHEIAPDEQESELERAFKRASHYGKMLGGQSEQSKFHNNCPRSKEKPMLLGKGGEHMVSICFCWNYSLLLNRPLHYLLLFQNCVM